MQKSDYHVLARFVDVTAIDQDVILILDTIADTAERATGAKDSI